MFDSWIDMICLFIFILHFSDCLCRIDFRASTGFGSCWGKVKSPPLLCVRVDRKEIESDNKPIEESFQEYHEPESFRPMISSENQASYSFITESCIEQKIWSNHFKYIAPDLLRVIAHAKFFIQNHPHISNEAKEKIERLEVYLQPCYSPSSIEVCGHYGHPDSISVQIHDTGFGGPGFFYSHRLQKSFIFGLLKNFGHIIYGDLDFLFQARTEQERLEAFEKCQDFYFQNKRAIYFALEVLGSKKAAVKFFQREHDSRYTFICSNYQSAQNQPVSEDLIGFRVIDMPCFYMRNDSILDHSLKTFNDKVSLIKTYGKEEVILISSGEIVKLPFKKSNPGGLNII